MSTFLCVIFVCGEISLAAKIHRLTTIDHINMSTGGLSNSCTKTLPLAASLVHNTSTGWHFFSFVYHGLGGFMSLYFSLFFFVFLFILLSHLICCGHVFVSRSVACTLVFSLISFVSESQMSIYIMMEWNGMK